MDIKDIFALFTGGGVITGGAVVMLYFWWKSTLPAKVSIGLIRTEALIFLIVLSYFAFAFMQHQYANTVIYRLETNQR